MKKILKKMPRNIRALFDPRYMSGRSRLLDSVLFGLDGLDEDYLIGFVKVLDEQKMFELDKPLSDYSVAELRSCLDSFIGEMFRHDVQKLRTIEGLLSSYLVSEMKKLRERQDSEKN